MIEMGLVARYVPVPDVETAYLSLLRNKKGGSASQVQLALHLHGPVQAHASLVTTTDATRLLRSALERGRVEQGTLYFLRVAEPSEPFTEPLRLRHLFPASMSDAEVRDEMARRAFARLYAQESMTGVIARMAQFTLSRSSDRPPLPVRSSITEGGVKLAVWTDRLPPVFFDTKEEAREYALPLLLRGETQVKIGRMALLEAWENDAPPQVLWYAAVRFEGFLRMEPRGTLFYMMAPGGDAIQTTRILERISAAIPLEERGFDLH